MKTTVILRLFAVALIAVSGSCLAADTLQLISPRSPAVASTASANGDSGLPIMSPDGWFVLFASSADDLLVMTNGARIAPLFPPALNVFLRDRTNATTTLVSVNLTGSNGGNGDSLPAGLSTDGRYVLFESSASDLIDGDTNGASDIFVRDLVAGTTLPVGVSTNGDLGNGTSRSAVMTPDGRYVAFVSAANNLVPGDTNRIPDVFLRDLQSGTTILVSAGAKSPPGTTPYGSSEAPEITPDGRYVAFYSTATNLVSGVTNFGEIYVRDLVAGTTVWVSAYARTALQLRPNTTNSLSFGHSVSADGQFVTYEAIPGNLVTVHQAPTMTTPGKGAILRYNVGSGLTDTLSTNAAVPVSAPEDARNPVMTPDGRFVAFVANGTPWAVTNTCILVWDAQTGTSVLASSDLPGTATTNATCDWPTITPDGRFVVFLSDAANLVTNSLVGECHLYARDLQTATTTLVDMGNSGAGSGVTFLVQAGLSDDGRFIAFEAPDGSLVPDDSNKCSDVFVRQTIGAATELISARDPALPSDTPNGASTLSLLSVSGQGSFVAFVSEADNLVPNDTNGWRDVFVRDLLADSTLLVSADMFGGAPGNGMSTEPVISADGRYVAFTSTATNLAAGDTNGASDVFVRDLLYETTQLVSVNPNGFSGNGASYSPMISADGRAVLFHSQASDLAPGAFGSDIENLFWRDLWSGTTYPLTAYTYAGYPSSVLAATMTPNGRFAVFGGRITSWYVWDSQTAAAVYTGTIPYGTMLSNVWASADGNRVAYLATANLYLVDRPTDTTLLMGGIRSSSHATPCFNADGRFFAYATSSTNAPADTNGFSDVYLYDCQAGSNVLVSQAFNAPAPANGDSDSPAISPDGRFVAYRSAASNLVPNDANGVPDIFLWDRLTGATLLVSVSRSMSASADNRSLTPVFSGDGRTLMFESWAADLVTGDLNRGSDLFVFNLYASSSIPLLKAAIVPGADPSQGLWITWPIIPGKAYHVQFKNSPGDAAWQTLGGSVTIVGNQGYLYDLALGSSQRFYRVVAQ
jgi:Tol biopolymer transport system component